MTYISYQHEYMDMIGQRLQYRTGMKGRTVALAHSRDDE